MKIVTGQGSYSCTVATMTQISHGNRGDRRARTRYEYWRNMSVTHYNEEVKRNYRLPQA